MSFELFDHRDHSRPDRPLVTIQRNGQLSLNRRAHEIIGSPRFVELMYDHKGQRIGLRPTREQTPASYTLASSGSAHHVTVKNYLREYNVDYSTTRRYEAVLEGNLLVIDLLGESVRSSRKPKATPLEAEHAHPSTSEQLALSNAS